MRLADSTSGLAAGRDLTVQCVAATDNPHRPQLAAQRARGIAWRPSPATSCLGASPTPAYC